MTHLTTAPHPEATAFTAPHVGASMSVEHVDARLVARLTPQSDLDFVLGAVPVPGPPGPPGEDGTQWFDGVGPPVEPIPGATAGDYYLDTGNGDVWQLAGSMRLRLAAFIPGGR